MKSIAFVPIILGVAFAAIACGSKDTAAAPSSGGDTAVAPKATPPGAVQASVAELKTPLTYTALKGFMERRCIQCHGVGKRIGGKFNMATYEGMMKGGEDGPMIKPGDPENSPLLAYLRGTKKPQMPLRQPIVVDADIQAISDWIKDGAKQN